MSQLSLAETGPIWKGSDLLRPYLVPLVSLRTTLGAAAGDLERIVAALDREGQVRPVLVDDDYERVVGRQHLVEAAVALGWTHIAVRLGISEQAVQSREQTSLFDEAEQRTPDDLATLKALAPAAPLEEEATDIEAINELSAAQKEWVGLPEFVPTGDPFKLVISCETEEDRDAIFDVLGIATIHKGTRGTLSVWWPDRPKEDLSSLRFEDA